MLWCSLEMHRHLEDVVSHCKTNMVKEIFRKVFFVFLFFSFLVLQPLREHDARHSLLHAIREGTGCCLGNSHLKYQNAILIFPPLF